MPKKQPTRMPTDGPKPAAPPETKLAQLGIFNVEIRDAPPQGPEAKEIHQRRILPSIPEASPADKPRKAGRRKER